VAGGFLVGIVENLVAFLGARFEAATGIYVVGTGEKLTLALVIIVAMLVVKPGGLFSGHRRERA
jgi:branched-chain amino acid transport system permease protein